MTRRIIAAFTAVACLGGLAYGQEEESPKVKASLSVDVLTKYIWRGLNFDNEAVLQPTLTLEYGGFSGWVFGSMELTNWNRYYSGIEHPAGTFMEYDLGLSYSGKCKNADWTLGAVNYVYPKQGYPQTTEVFASVSVPVLLKPTVTVYHDVDYVHGWYGTLGISHTFDKSLPHKDGWLPLELAATLGAGDNTHNTFYYWRQGPEFTDLLLRAACPIKINDKLTVTPSLNYSSIVSEAIRPDGIRRNNMYLGVNLSYLF